MTNVDSIAHQLDCGCPTDATGFHFSGLFTVKTVGVVEREPNIDLDGTPGYRLELDVTPLNANGTLTAFKYGISHPLLTRESDAFPKGRHVFIKGHLDTWSSTGPAKKVLASSATTTFSWSLGRRSRRRR